MPQCLHVIPPFTKVGDWSKLARSKHSTASPSRSTGNRVLRPHHGLQAGDDSRRRPDPHALSVRAYRYRSSFAPPNHTERKLPTNSNSQGIPCIIQSRLYHRSIARLIRGVIQIRGSLPWIRMFDISHVAFANPRLRCYASTDHDEFTFQMPLSFQEIRKPVRAR